MHYYFLTRTVPTMKCVVILIFTIISGTYMNNVCFIETNTYMRVWINAAKTRNELAYEWCDNNEILDFHSNWQDNEPSFSRENSCVQLSPTGYQTVACNTLAMIVCQDIYDVNKEQVLPKLQDFPTFIKKPRVQNNQLSWYNDTGYHFIPYQLSWLEALRVCQCYNMDLASFETMEEFGAVMNMFKTQKDVSIAHIKLGGSPFTYGFWAGGTDLLEEKKWIWTQTGQKVFSQIFNFGEPNNLQRDFQNCMFLSVISNNAYDDNCFNLRFAVCKCYPGLCLPPKPAENNEMKTKVKVRGKKN